MSRKTRFRRFKSLKGVWIVTIRASLVTRKSPYLGGHWVEITGD